MARLEAIEKLLYYPTDLIEIRLFCHNLRISNKFYRLFDPCIGDGDAVVELGKSLTCSNGKPGEPEIIGVELDISRAELARTKDMVKHVVNSGIENIGFENVPDLVFMNPPYDLNPLTGRRMELEWIELIAAQMQTGMSMILVLPVMFFEGGKYHDQFRLSLYKSNLSLYPKNKNDYNPKEFHGGYRFTDENYPKFKQVMVLVKKTHNMKLLDKIPVDGIVGENNHVIEIKNAPYSRSDWGWENASNKFDVYKMQDEIIESVLDDIEIKKLFGDPSNEMMVAPLMKMRTETIAAVIAGGMFSGIRVGDEVVRGGITIRKEESEDIEGDVKTVVSVDVMIANLSVLDLKTGEISTYTSDQEEFGDRIEVVASAVKEELDRQYPDDSLEVLAKYEHLFNDIHGPRAIKEHVNGLFDPQKIAVATVLKGWENGLKSIILLGEMGVGKTIVSIASAVAMIRRRKEDAQKVVILLPAKDDLQDKWKEEIATSCRDLPHKIFIIQTVEDARKAFQNKGLTFVLVKETMAKRTSGWEHISGGGKCFNCGEKLVLLNSEEEPPEKDSEFRYCSKCKTGYYQYTRTKGKAYSSVAKYISQRFGNSYVLIIDEAHQFKGGDTARGYASHALIRGAWRDLVMTGTIYNGYASSIFYTLYRTQGSFREAWNYEAKNEFVRFYGLEKRTTKVKRRSNSASWSGYNTSQNTKVDEIPGIHPRMISSMLPYTIFMKLSDFNESIPKQRGHTLFLDLPQEVMDEYSSTLDAAYDAGIQEMQDEEDPSMSMLSQFTWANLGVWDVYPDGDRLETFYESGELRNGFDFPPKLSDKLTPKEEAIIRLMYREKMNNDPVLLFYLQTDRRPIDVRLSKILEKYGMSVAYMPATVSHRVPFVEKALLEGKDAILCNANLVREGIDLLQFRLIIWVSATDDAILVNQANARNHRLGQWRETDVVYLGYQKTRQAERWGVTAEKVAAMSAAHGDVRQGLAALLGTKNLISTLQDALIEYDKQASDWSLDDLPPMPGEVIDIVPELVVEAVKEEEDPAQELVEWYNSNDALKQMTLF